MSVPNVMAIHPLVVDNSLKTTNTNVISEETPRIIRVIGVAALLIRVKAAFVVLCNHKAQKQDFLVFFFFISSHDWSPSVCA